MSSKRTEDQQLAPRAMKCDQMPQTPCPASLSGVPVPIGSNWSGLVVGTKLGTVGTDPSSRKPHPGQNICTVARTIFKNFRLAPSPNGLFCCRELAYPILDGPTRAHTAHTTRLFSFRMIRHTFNAADVGGVGPRMSAASDSGTPSAKPWLPL
jgi:hypothetical protein